MCIYIHIIQNCKMEAAALPLGLVIGVAIIGILIELIGYKVVLIIFGVIVIIVVGFWITVAVSFKNTVNMVKNGPNPTAPSTLPPTSPSTSPSTATAQLLNGGNKHGNKHGKKRK